MQAFELVIHLLEKVAVLVATALVLLPLRPAEVWLVQTGEQASVRRRVFLVALLGALAVWGTFLGFEIEGMQFNIRMVGIIVAGYLGGVWVGLAVGALAGILYAFEVPGDIAPYVFLASILDGTLAGLWSKRFGTRFGAVFVGALAIQLVHHVGVGAIMAVVDFALASFHARMFMLHGAKIAANTIGVMLFMGLLSLVRQLEQARRDVKTSQDQARSARLEALQYQLKPHFLFNLLNTLSYLIRTDPARARELTLELSEFLRYTLARQDDRTTLGDELDQIARYVELERARFGAGLVFEVVLPDDVRQAAELSSALVPPLILQPLVENAIRHGSRQGSVHVELRVERTPDAIAIHVLDDGPGPTTRRSKLPLRRPLPQRALPHRGKGHPGEGSGHGLGLENVRERLERFYHGEASLELAARDDGTPGARATVRLPLTAGAPRRGGLGAQAREKLRQVVG